MKPTAAARLCTALSFCLLLQACASRSDTGSGSRPDPADRPVVCAANYPLAYFAKRIGGGTVEVRLPVPADEDPAYWQPDEAAIGRLQESDLILLNGAGYEKWLPHVSLPPSRVLDTSRGFADRYLELEDQVIHRHGPEGEHAHGGYAFTTWLDPRLAMAQAEGIHQALSDRWPANSEKFDAGWRQLRGDLESLDEALSEATSGYSDQPLLASHPVYQYLARRCGWNLKSVHWEPGEPPTDEQWQAMQTMLASHPAKWMIWEGEPDEQTARRLKASGVSCVVFSPCANAPPTGDYLEVMRENVERLTKLTK